MKHISLMNHRAGLVAFAGALVLSGCGGLSGFGGGSSLTCKLPDGARCDSLSNTYSESTRGLLPGQIKRGGMEQGPSGAVPSNSAYTLTRGGAGREPGDPVVQLDPRMTQMGMPLRSQPRIARVWIKPWEDSDGDLHDQTFVYLPVDEGKWLVDHKQREVREAYAPGRSAPQSLSAQVAAMNENKQAQSQEASGTGKPSSAVSALVQRTVADKAATSGPRAQGGGNSGR